MHEIQALVGVEEVVAAAENMWGAVNRRPLTSELFILPITDSLLTEMIGRRFKWPDLEELPGGNEDLAKALGPILSAIGKAMLPGPIALLITQYFGGVGEQAAAFVNNGGPQIGPILGPESINTVLFELGVRRDLVAGRDEFHVAGLGRWRSNDDILGHSG